MMRWLLLVALGILAACTTTPTPPPPTLEVLPPATVLATVAPVPTLLPTVTVIAPTLGTATETPIPTTGAVTIRATRVPTGIGAPNPLAPQGADLFKNGNDIEFKYASVGKLEPNQCYLLHIELAVPNLPEGNRGDDFLDVANCGDQGPAGKELAFVLYRGKYTNSPNYGTMLAQTLELDPEIKVLDMTWTVRVVQNNGRSDDGVHYNTVALSQPSPMLKFVFQP